MPLLTFPLLVHPPCFSAVWTNINKFKFKTGKGQGPKRTYNFFLFSVIYNILKYTVKAILMLYQSFIVKRQNRQFRGRSYSHL